MKFEDVKVKFEEALNKVAMFEMDEDGWVGRDKYGRIIVELNVPENIEIHKWTAKKALEQIKEQGDYYEEKEWEHILGGYWKELRDKEKEGYEVVDEDGTPEHVKTFRMWVCEGDVQFSLILFEDGRYELGDEGMGVAEEGVIK